MVVVAGDITIIVLGTRAEDVGSLQGDAPQWSSIAKLGSDVVRAEQGDGCEGGVVEFLGDRETMVVHPCQPSAQAWLEHGLCARGEAMVVGRGEVTRKACIVLVGLHKVVDSGVARFGVEGYGVVLLVSPDLPYEGVGVTVVDVADRAVDAQVSHLVLGTGVDAAVTLQGTVLECEVPDDMMLRHAVAPAERVLFGAHAAADGVASEIGIEQFVVSVLHPPVALALPPCVARFAKDTADIVDVEHRLCLHTETAVLHTRKRHGRLPEPPLHVGLRGGGVQEQ